MKRITSIVMFSFMFFALGARAQSDSIIGAVIQFEKRVHDFGTIKKNSNGSCVFKFKNVGDQPLVLSDVFTSCGCTTPKWTKKPIMPGKTGVVKVKYDTNRTGVFNKTVTVISNAIDDKIVLVIKGYIPT